MDAAPTEPHATSERTAASLCEQAREHLKQLHVEEGEAAARQAVELDPQSDDAHTLLGIALCRRGKNTEGIEALGRAVTINPSNVTARSNLATARQQAGHLEAARAEWLTVLALDPNNTKARGALAVVEWQIHQATGDPSMPAAQHSAPQPVQPVQPLQPGPQQAAPAAVRHDLAGNPIPVAQEPLSPGEAVAGRLPGQQPQASYYEPMPQRRYGAGRTPDAGYSSHTAAGDDPGGWSPGNVAAILFSPTAFFHDQHGHYAITKPLLFSIINGLILSTIMLSVMLVRFAQESSRMGGSGLAIGAGLAGMLIGWMIGFAIGIGVQFAAAGLVHLIARAFGGREPYGATYRALIYAATPSTVCYAVAMAAMQALPALAIPAGVLVFAGVIWSVVVGVIGLGVMQDISSWSAFGVLFLSFIALFVIGLAVGIVFGGVMAALIGMRGSTYPGGYRQSPFSRPPGLERPYLGPPGFQSAPPGFQGPSGFGPSRRTMPDFGRHM